MRDTGAPAITVAGLLAGNRRVAGRMITLVESGGPQTESVMRAVYPHTGRAYLVGITGPPGAGKSTLVDELIAMVRKSDQTVGVIGVDPNSPFSGGAILGDRIRMNRHATDPGVFIRSMGARGQLGGLAAATRDTMLILDAMGMDIVLVETVGVGQSELEIASAADTTVVVLPAGQGDSVQTIKAGVMEIADVFAVNKADEPQAERTLADVHELLRTAPTKPKWSPAVVKTIGTRGEGVAELWSAILRHRDFTQSDGEFERRRTERATRDIMLLAEQRLRNEYLQPRLQEADIAGMVELTVKRKMDPYDVVEHVVHALALQKEGTP